MARKPNYLCRKSRYPQIIHFDTISIALPFFVYRNPSEACLQQLQCTCRQSMHMLRWWHGKCMNAQMMTRQVHEVRQTDDHRRWTIARVLKFGYPQIRHCDASCSAKSRGWVDLPKHHFSGKFRGSVKIPKHQFSEICHFRKFLNRQIAVKIHRVSSEISGKFGTFGIITWCIGSIPATSVGFPTEAPTFSTGVPFYVII